MPTSGSTDFTLNTTEIITHALNLINAIPLGQSVAPHIYSACLKSLNLMTKSWMAEGRFLWGLTERTGVALTANKASYSIGPSGADITMEKPMRILSVRLRHTTDEVDIPLDEIMRDEYQNGISAKTSVSGSGFPTVYYYDPQLSTGTLYLSSVPDSSTASDYTLRFDYPRRIEDFDDTTDDPDYIQEMLENVVYNLAVRIRPLFPAIKLNDIADVVAIANGLYQIMPVHTGPNDENPIFQPYLEGN